MVYQGLAIPDRMGVSQIGGHNHCAFPASQESDVEAFITKFLLGGNTNTAIVKTDATYTFDTQKWVDWTIPVLN